jgi:hypothetical protein
MSTRSVVRTATKSAIALGFIGALALGGAAPAAAFYVSGPGFHVWVGPHHRHYYNYYRGGYYGGGAGTWNGCPPNWTIQGGACKPYRYGPWDYYNRY